MKRSGIILMCLFAMVLTSLNVKAQEVTVVLNPGWTWISFPGTEPQNFATALGSFVPMEGDMIKSQWGNASFRNGQWKGQISQFYPGYGYHYKSNRQVPEMITMGNPLPSLTVTTSEPMDITTNSATSGGSITTDAYIFTKGICWATHPEPTPMNDDHSENGGGDESFTAEMTDLNQNTTYYVRAYAVTQNGLAYGEELSFTTNAEHEYVDLGLPSGLLWATCNLGADIPEEYGDYFAWGETQPKDDFSWTNYQYCMGSFNTLTKYCNNPDIGYNGFTDDLTTLLPEDDAATANWGDEWRMPTQAEWQELYQNTTVTWTTQNGVRGRLFTASNGNSLFMPAAGYCNESFPEAAGIIGDYWTSSLDTDYPSGALSFFFNSSNYYIGFCNRLYGRNVRAVYSESQNTSFIIDAIVNPTEGGTVSGGGSYQVGTECTLTATANEGFIFTNWTENDEVVSTDATYTFAVSANRTLVANFTYSGGTGDMHAYVDLGLPSGLLWATCNVGADSPAGYGDYFAWGETLPKSTYIGDTYTYNDNPAILPPDHDAATANWGNGWRMPTSAEWQELCNNTTVTWTIQNGVNGRRFTASNGNSLFLPAAGYCADSGLDVAGIYGSYWSSSINTIHPYDAVYFVFYSEDFYMFYYYRYYGRSVRPVRSSQNNAPTGAINGKFTINDNGDQVYFSQGNLQYQASTNTWKFAENQYDYVGSDNSNISSAYSGWIDLFGWATSGYNHGANFYQPWSTSQTNSDYYAYGSYTYSLYDQTGQADWGYNPISNGGNTANQWRTLTQPEWNYVFNTRTTTSGIRYAKANVNNVNGVILLPDDWSTSTYSLSNTNSSGASFSSNTMTASQWSTLEQAGAVFLSAAGLRNGTSVNDVGSYGSYWSASYNGSNGAYYVSFDDSGLSTSYNYSRCYGRSVRLVRVAEN